MYSILFLLAAGYLYFFGRTHIEPVKIVRLAPLIDRLMICIWFLIIAVFFASGVIGYFLFSDNLSYGFSGSDILNGTIGVVPLVVSMCCFIDLLHVLKRRIDPN